MAIGNIEGANDPSPSQTFYSKPLWFLFHEQRLQDSFHEIIDATQMVVTEACSDQKEIGEAEVQMEYRKQDPCLQAEFKTDIETTRKQEKPTLWQESTNVEKYLLSTMTFSKLEDQEGYRMISKILTEYSTKSAEEEEHQYWAQISNAIFNKTKNRPQPLREMLQFITDNFKTKNY